MGEIKRKPDVVTLETLDLRVFALEEGFHSLRGDVSGAVREIKSNTALTEQIQGTVEDVKSEQATLKAALAAVKTDTASIVTATKWVATTKRGLVALCVVATALSTAMLGAIKLAHELGWIR